MTNTNNEKVVVRFPPSPTGPLHIGNVRTALYNYLFARQNNGKFLLRIEDTDKERSKKEFEDDILNSLKWLSLEYNGDVLKSSERLDIYKEKINDLIKTGRAYIAEEQNIDKEARPTEQSFGRVVRFKNPGGKIKFTDLIRGEVEMEVGDLEDFIIAKNINEPIYHLAVVVDDMASSITHIIRGEDHISNTPRQILIWEALGGTRPIYAHLPLILAEDKSKLSKRKHGEVVSLDYYHKQGYLPEAIINFLALIGWNPGTDQEIFSIKDLIEKFDLSKVQKGGAVFNQEKLDWVNKEHIKMLSEEVRNKNILERLNKCGIGEKVSEKVYPLIFDRISKWSDIDIMVGAGELDYYFTSPIYETSLLLWKGESQDEAKKHLELVVQTIKNSSEEEFSSVEKVKNLIFDYATNNGRGQVLWPIRVALSGREKSPDPFTLLYILGKEESFNRINNAIKKLS